ncbi:unknown [Acidaminococcus sp. CAG:917]|nr:unknown [Acidaminococcus sp. CAG:917]
MKKFKLPLLLLAVCLIVCLIGVMAACNGETATDGTQDNIDPILPSPPEEEKPEQTVEELSKAECENILQAKTENLLSSAEVANVEGIQLYKEYYPIPYDNYNPDFVLSTLFNFSDITITKINLNGGEVFGSCTLTAKSDGALHSVYFVLKTNLFSLDRTSYEVLKEELAYLNAYYVSVYENSADIPATDGFFDFNSLVAGETVPSPLTEEDYKAQCTEIINAIALFDLNVLSNKYTTVSGLTTSKINTFSGFIFGNATFTASLGTSSRSIVIFQTNLNELVLTSYEALCENLYGFEVVSMESQTNIQPEVSAEAYANLVNFVISNSIGWGPAGTDVEILNVSTFKALTDGSGQNYCSIHILKNDTLYEIRAKGPTGIGRQEDHIEALLECQAEEITFTSESFSDFNDIGK